MSRKISYYFKSNRNDKNIDVIVDLTEDSPPPAKKIKIYSNGAIKLNEKRENSSTNQEFRVVLKDFSEKNNSKRVRDESMLENEQTDEKMTENYQKTTKITKNQNSSLSCTICNKKLSTKAILKDHMKFLHPETLKNLMPCQICGRKFIQKHALKMHLKVKHFDGKIHLFECDICGKGFGTKKKIRLHLTTHLPLIKCKICQLELKIASLRFHLKQFHATEHKFQCQMCSKLFKSQTYLNNHKKYHEKKFVCVQCNKKFAFQALLNYHVQKYHENPKSFRCETCNKSFTHKHNLKSHQKIHEWNRQKSFKCQRCNFATDAKDRHYRHLKYHQRKDEEFAAMINPLKCPKCPAFYKDICGLNRHLKKGHPQELFQCDLCGNYLKAKSSLKGHINNHILKFSQILNESF